LGCTRRAGGGAEENHRALCYDLLCVPRLHSPRHFRSGTAPRRPDASPDRSSSADARRSPADVRKEEEPNAPPSQPQPQSQAQPPTQSQAQPSTKSRSKSRQVSVKGGGGGPPVMQVGPSWPNDDNSMGAVWFYTQSGGVWTQQGTKMTTFFGPPAGTPNRSPCPTTVTSPPWAPPPNSEPIFSREAMAFGTGPY
jgi:hypothetical protein